MSERAELLAKRFLQAHDEVRAVVERCTDKQWKLICAAERESVSLVIHHIAVGYSVELDLFTGILNGQPIPAIYTDETLIDPWHAEHGRQFRDCGREETLALLCRNSTDVAHFIAGLSDEQLDTTVDLPLLVHWWGTPVRLEQAIENLLLGHPPMHLPSIRVTIASAAQF